MQGEETVPTEFKLTHQQVSMIRNHLNMVFKHEIDPSMGDQKKQGELNKLHIGRVNPNPVARC